MKQLDKIFRNRSGMSLIEMLACVAIISIVSTGLLALVGINTAWILRLSNKTDNMASSQAFIDRLVRELRSANGVMSGSTNQVLTIFVPIFQSDQGMSQARPGFPTGNGSNSNVDTITYQVTLAQAPAYAIDGGANMPDKQYVIT